MKMINYVVISAILLMLSSASFASPLLAPNFTTADNVLFMPFFKQDGILTHKNVRFLFNPETMQYEELSREEVLPDDIIKIDENVSLASGSFKEFKFNGFTNVPVLISTQRTQGTVRRRIEILDSSGFVLNSTVAYTVAFTPINDDVFTLRVSGRSGSGQVQVKGSVLTRGAISERNQVRPILLNEGKTGTLAARAFDDYRYTGIANDPIEIQFQRQSGGLRSRIQVFDSAGVLLKSTVAHTVSFTPPADGDYIIRILGRQSFGDYVVRLVRP